MQFWADANFTKFSGGDERGIFCLIANLVITKKKPKFTFKAWYKKNVHKIPFFFVKSVFVNFHLFSYSNI